MAQHKTTPGPWHWRRDANIVDADHNRIQIADLYGTRPGDMDAPLASVRTANGLLIAAAPDIYAALRELIERRDRASAGKGKRERDGSDGRYARARAALRKADGDAP